MAGYEPSEFLTIDQSIRFINLRLNISCNLSTIEKYIKQGQITPLVFYVGWAEIYDPASTNAMKILGFEYKLPIKAWISFYGEINLNTLSDYEIMTAFIYKDTQGEIKKGAIVHLNNSTNFHYDDVRIPLSELQAIIENENKVNILLQGNADNIGTPTISNAPPTPPHAQKQIDDLTAENNQLKEKIAQLEQQIGTPAKTEIFSIELHNLKQAVIVENNRQIATVLQSLDYQNLLTKDDLLQVIRPNMESMAKVLNGDKYKTLVVTDDTIKKEHFATLSFKTGRKPKKQTEKNSIQLIFDRQKTIQHGK